ncbi:MAG: serine hydrolase domain-containing protein [Candidatus Hydrogenedentota bacterium]
MNEFTRRTFLSIAGAVATASVLSTSVVSAQSALGSTETQFGLGVESKAARKKLDGSALKALNHLFEKQIIDGVHPGAQLTVRIQDETVFNRYGGWAITPSKCMELDTKMLMFSATKPLGAACVMMLVEEGYLELDTPLIHYWPAFSRGDSRKKGVTVRHVLTHQGGFPLGPSDFNYEEFNDSAEAMRAMERIELKYEPGTQYEYHPINYGWALGELVRRTSGMSVELFFNERLVEPLGCINMSLGVPPDELDEISYMYRVNDRSHAIEIWNSPTVRMAPCVASSGHAPAEDLARFYDMIARGGLTADGTRLLKKKTVKMMTTAQPIEKTGELTEYGLGFGISADEGRMDYYGHGGSSSSFGRHDPSRKMTVAFITNGHQDPDIHEERMDSIWSACQALVG